MSGILNLFLDISELGDPSTPSVKSNIATSGTIHSEPDEHNFAVPGHFYKLCATKSDQTVLEQDIESYLASSMFRLINIQLFLSYLFFK